ncbi:MAG: hypothetical protein ABIB71_00450 [Candidatus Woesearchaeota archaeon]
MGKEYGIIRERKPRFPIRELLRVPHKKETLTFSFPAFGPSSYREFLRNISHPYTHPTTRKKINFRRATTSESISAVSYNFERLFKEPFFDWDHFYVGLIVRTSEGVFTNTTITNEKSLKKLLDKAKKTRGIYLTDEEIGFVPYDSFRNNYMQKIDTFAKGGLARVLEHTSEKVALKLRQIASSKSYTQGVTIAGFDEVKKPVKRIACLFSGSCDRGLVIHGEYGCDVGGGYSFGVIEQTRK